MPQQSIKAGNQRTNECMFVLCWLRHFSNSSKIKYNMLFSNMLNQFFLSLFSQIIILFRSILSVNISDYIDQFLVNKQVEIRDRSIFMQFSYSLFQYMKHRLNIQIVPVKNFVFQSTSSNLLSSHTESNHNKYKNVRNFLLLRNSSKNKRKLMKHQKQTSEDKLAQSRKKRPTTGITRKSNSTQYSMDKLGRAYHQKYFDEQNPERIKTISNQPLFKQAIVLKNYFPLRKSLKCKDFRWQKYYSYVKTSQKHNSVNQQIKQQNSVKWFGDSGRLKTAPSPTPSRYPFSWPHKKAQILKHKRSQSGEQVCPWVNTLPDIAISSLEFSPYDFHIK